MPPCNKYWGFGVKNMLKRHKKILKASSLVDDALTEHAWTVSSGVLSTGSAHAALTILRDAPLRILAACTGNAFDPSKHFSLQTDEPGKNLCHFFFSTSVSARWCRRLFRAASTDFSLGKDKAGGLSSVYKYGYTHTHKVTQSCLNKTNHSEDIEMPSAFGDTKSLLRGKKTTTRRTACALTNDHQGELKAPLDRLPIHLVGEACKADISF